MKNIKNILIAICLSVAAGLLILIGVIYVYWGGDWSKIPEILSSDFAITTYIILGASALLISLLMVLVKRNDEIK